MNRKTLLLIILPILLVVTAAVLNHARGPYWLAGNLDPDYLYLLNATNMAHFKDVGHIDHPGTTVQALGAVVLRVIHLFGPSGFDDLASHVVNRPEKFLNAVQTVFTVINGFMLFYLGFVGFRCSKNIVWSLWLQLAPFCTMTIMLAGLTRMTPEPLLFTAGLWFSVLMVKYLYPGENGDTGGLRLALLFALAAGFGMATKITFAPLLVIPFLVLRGLKLKGIYVGGTVVSFILFTLPIVGMYGKLFKWIYNLLIHKSRYGTGEVGVISLSRYLENIWKLLSGHPLFTGVLFAAFVVVVLGAVLPKLRRVSFKENAYRLLAALVIAQAFGVVMAAKHPAGHYLLPALTLTGITVAVLFYYCRLLAPLFKWTPKKLSAVFVPIVVLSIILVNPPGSIARMVKQLSALRNQSLAAYEHAGKMDEKKPAKIYYYAGSSPEYAFKYGNNLSRNVYASRFEARFPHAYFYNEGRRVFYRYDYRYPVSFGVIRARHNDNVIVQGPKRVKIPGIRLIERFKNRFGESVFQLDPRYVAAIDKTAAWLVDNIEGAPALIVPDAWGGSARQLQDRFPVVMRNFSRLNKTTLVHLAVLFDNPYFVIPSQKGARVKPGALRKEFDSLDDCPGGVLAGRFKENIFQRYAALAERETIKVWYPRKGNPARVAPGLHFLKGKENFTMEMSRENGRNMVTISPVRGNIGKKMCRVGFRSNKEGFKMNIPPGGRFVHLVVKADIPLNLASGGNFLYIRDFNGTWKQVRKEFNGAGPVICTVSKKIRPKSTRLRFGLHFTAGSPSDKLVIKDIKLYVTK